MGIRDEWHKLTEELKEVYIFGTGEVGRRLYKLLTTNSNKTIILGYVVTKREEYEIDEIPVYIIDDNEVNYDIPILVSVTKIYHPEVYEILQLKFKNIIPAHRFYSMDAKGINGKNEDFSYTNSDLSSEFKKLRDSVYSDYEKNNAAWGGNIGFYQSFPTLAIQGYRPTEKRIEEYGLFDYVNKKSKILDIGSNCGFLDMEISNKVGSIVGLEYNDELSAFATRTKIKLGINNIEFVTYDFNEWVKRSIDKFDVIFSFAVHVWIDMPPEEYAYELDKRMCEGGIIFMESHGPTDKMYPFFCDEIIKRNYSVENKKMINDNGKMDRLLMVLRKRG